MEALERASTHSWYHTLELAPGHETDARAPRLGVPQLKSPSDSTVPHVVIHARGPEA